MEADRTKERWKIQGNIRLAPVARQLATTSSTKLSTAGRRGASRHVR
jgi:hypothetical protein